MENSAFSFANRLWGQTRWTVLFQGHGQTQAYSPLNKLRIKLLVHVVPNGSGCGINFSSKEMQQLQQSNWSGWTKPLFESSLRMFTSCPLLVTETPVRHQRDTRLLLRANAFKTKVLQNVKCHFTRHKATLNEMKERKQRYCVTISRGFRSSGGQTTKEGRMKNTMQLHHFHSLSASQRYSSGKSQEFPFKWWTVSLLHENQCSSNRFCFKSH